MDYKKAGVNIEAGNEASKRITRLAQKTFNQHVLTGIGGFSGLFAFDHASYKEPVLVSSTDGVGTKVMIAQMMDKHDTVGIDLVAMAVNDLICMGADPLFFLDYIACGVLDPAKIEQIIKGISEGCVQSGCALIGGETAEMPGIYRGNDYDLAGFVVGVVDKNRMITGHTIEAGDVLIGIASSGLHSNGYSLVRKVLFETAGWNPSTTRIGIPHSLGEELLVPTRIYVSLVKQLKENFCIKGIAHITGGAFYDKIIRIVPNPLGISIRKGSWPVPRIFKLIEEQGKIPWEEMYRTFNMGIGLVLVVGESLHQEVLDFLSKINEPAYKIGQVSECAGQVEIA